MRELIESIEEYYEIVGRAICGLVIVITSPLWILPYKFRKGAKKK